MTNETQRPTPELRGNRSEQAFAILFPKADLFKLPRFGLDVFVVPAIELIQQWFLEPSMIMKTLSGGYTYIRRIDVSGLSQATIMNLLLPFFTEGGDMPKSNETGDILKRDERLGGVIQHRMTVSNFSQHMRAGFVGDFSVDRVRSFAANMVGVQDAKGNPTAILVYVRGKNPPPRKVREPVPVLSPLRLAQQEAER